MAPGRKPDVFLRAILTDVAARVSACPRRSGAFVRLSPSRAAIRAATSELRSGSAALAWIVGSWP